MIQSAEKDDSQEINTITFSREGKRVVTASWAGVKVWETLTGKRLRGITEYVGFTSAAVHGELIVAGTEENSVKVWDARKDKELRTLRGHTQRVWCVALSHDGRFVWSGSGDGTTRMWRISDGRELMRLISIDQSDDWLAITPDGNFDSSEGGSKLVAYRNPVTGELIDTESVRRKFHRPGQLMDNTD